MEPHEGRFPVRESETVAYSTGKKLAFQTRKEEDPVHITNGF